MRQSYQVVEKNDSRALAQFLAKDGQILLPMVDLITSAAVAVDEVIDQAGRAVIEAILQMSAAEVVGAPHPGKAAGAVRRHGRQRGVVTLAERKLAVEKPRLRRTGGGAGAEVPIPAYAAMQTGGRLAQRMLDILLRGVTTRRYAGVLPQMAQTVGVSKSSVSRGFIEASAAQLKTLCERRFDETTLLILYIDGLVFGTHRVLVALGVDPEGHKHVLGLVAGASENERVVKDLLEDLVARGVKPDRRRLFVIDGSPALRAGIAAVYGAENPVQRCRAHKIRNVMDHLPKDRRKPVQSAMRAAWRLEWPEGMKRLETQAAWLDQEYPSAAASLREGLEETFTINRLELPPALRRGLATTNLIESPNAGVRQRTDRVGRWQDEAMVLRWTAAALVETEKHFRRLMGYEHLWILEAALRDPADSRDVASNRKVG